MDLNDSHIAFNDMIWGLCLLISPRIMSSCLCLKKNQQ